MKEKFLLLILITSVILVDAFLVVALVNQDDSENLSQQTSLQLIDFDEDDELEDELNDNEGQDLAITGNAFDRASAVALEYIREGKVTDTELGDEDGYYEIEITLNNGKEVDVHLDEDYKVISTEYD